MAPKKQAKRRAGASRPDRYSKRRNGYVTQSIRLSVDHNKLIREAAALDGYSITLFATQTLVKAAKARLAKEKQEAEESEGN